MKFKKILILGILVIAIVVLFLALKEEVKVPNVNEAFALLKENYSADISNNYSVINITNGWKFEFLKIEGNCSLECIKRNIYFEVYKNGSIVRSEKSTNITIIENENNALNYVLYRFPEFNISNNYSVINITNGWRFEFLRTEENRSIERIEKYVDFWVYKNGSITKSEKSTNITKIENENDALNYVLFRFPEFKNISKCEFEENLMCHEDVIIEKVDERWNVTFMKESKRCNNECVIRHYYSFLVGEDGKVRKDISEKKIGLEEIFEKVEKVIVYPERKPGELGLGGTRTRGWLQIDGVINAIERNDSIYLELYIPATNMKYVTKHGKRVYNILTEKFSTKTINNESDVLEAFGGYLRVFGLGKVRYVTFITTKETKREKLFKEEDYYPLYEREEFKNKMKYKIYRENKSWILECEIKDCIGRDWIEGNIKARISEKGRVHIIEKNIDVDARSYMCILL